MGAAGLLVAWGSGPTQDNRPETSPVTMRIGAIAAFIAAGTIWAAIELVGAADCAVGVNCVLTCAVCDRLAVAMAANDAALAGTRAGVEPALLWAVVADRGTGLVHVESIGARCGAGVARNAVLCEVVLGEAGTVCLGVGALAVTEVTGGEAVEVVPFAAGMVDFNGVLTVDAEPFDEEEPVEEPELSVSADAIPALWVITTPRPSATAAAPTRPTCLARPDVVSASLMGASSRPRLFNFPQKDSPKR